MSVPYELPHVPTPHPLPRTAQAPCPQCGDCDITYRLDTYRFEPRPDLVDVRAMEWRWTCETCATWGYPTGGGLP